MSVILEDLQEQPLHLLYPLGLRGSLAPGFTSPRLLVFDSCSSVPVSSKTCVVSIA